MSFNLDEYEPVAARLARALEAHPGLRVVTDLGHYLPDIAVFKAELWLGDVLMATGWEEEIRSDRGVNKTSHLANAETSAVGRALANMGFAGSDPAKRPSREEMNKVQRMGATVPGYGGKTIKNKFPNACVKCGARVETGEGLAQQNAQGKWETFHSEGKCDTGEAPF